MDDEDSFERTLLQLPQCHVFKIPVRKSADGHRASDWPTEHTWAGKEFVKYQKSLLVF
jgi:hypothetical protein